MRKHGNPSMRERGMGGDLLCLSPTWRHLAAAFMTLLPPGVVAQIGSPGLRADLQQLRNDAMSRSSANRGLTEAEAYAAAEQPWEFDLAVPAVYNSNAENVPSGGSQTLEWNPDASLYWARDFKSGVRVSVTADANSDRYAHSSGADLDTAYAKFRVQRVSGRNDQEFQYFVEYVPRLLFEPTFSKNDETTHDFAAGVTKTFNFDASGKLIPCGKDTSSNAVWSLVVIGSIQRRHANAESSSDRLDFHPALTYWPTGSKWNETLEVDANWRRNDAVDGLVRRDTYLTSIVTVEYASAAASIGSPKVDFQIIYGRFESNKSGIAFQQWAIGPSIKASWKF